MYPIRMRSSALIIEDDAVLLIEFKDENGVHYNLPGGGVEAGESLIEAMEREAREEASVEVEVGEAVLIYEYAPHLNNEKYGSIHSVTTIFECSIRDGKAVQMPAVPDKNQTAVKWVSLNDLHKVILYPNIRDQIINYSKHKKMMGFLEEHELETY